jgi:uncharacterized membrane protein HdeD (DUF308 family)
MFEDLVSDASELVRDLYWGVKNYLLFGLMSMLFGVHELVSNIDLLEGRIYVPLLVAGALIFCGLAQIVTFFRLRKKYSRLFKVREELKTL